MKKLAPNRQEMVLDAMVLSLERGSFPCLRSFIADFKEAFLANNSQIIQERFCALERAAIAGEAHEEVHGRYSLLKLDHPLNRILVAQGIVEDPARQLAMPISDLRAATA